jgi:hypothetical protein
MDCWEIETIVRKAFDGLDVNGLTYRKMMKMYGKGCYLIRILRGDKIDPQEAMERDAGFTQG